MNKENTNRNISIQTSCRCIIHDDIYRNRFDVMQWSRLTSTVIFFSFFFTEQVHYAETSSAVTLKPTLIRFKVSHYRNINDNKRIETCPSPFSPFFLVMSYRDEVLWVTAGAPRLCISRLVSSLNP